MSDSINGLLEERKNNYGNFHTHANLTQTLNKIITQHFTAVHGAEGKEPPQMPNFMAEAIHMICHKLARIVNGNPQYIDSWDDIAGYSLRVVEILRAYEDMQKQMAEAELAKKAQEVAEVVPTEEAPTKTE